ncbi:hypothetical protein EJ07DRAFT_95252 [Lizonia empirigonia]|nr:hypothetical protein EJ07DRAFT_95252 [Lizonia empirigonia]
MSGPVTEIAYLPFKPDVSLDSGDASTAWHETLSTIAQQPGFIRLSWGLQIETPTVVQMAIDWTSLAAHNAFIASLGYAPFLARLAPLLGAAPHLFHLQLPAPTGPSPFDAPVTECITLYHPLSVSEAAYNASFASFVGAAGRVADAGTLGLCGGWAVETQRGEGEREGVEKKAFGVFIGWPSVERHMEFRKREEFGGVAEYLREGVEKVKMHHVAFRRFEG